MDLTSSDLELISEGENGLDWQVVGLQYGSLGIGRLSTINNAFITFRVDPGEVDLAGTIELSIFAHLSPNSATISANDFDLTSRTRTLARVDWDLSTTNPATGLPYTENQTIVTPNLAPLLQELVNQVGWEPNSQLTLLFIPDAYLANPNGANFSLPEIEIASRDLTPPSFSPLVVDFTAVPEPSSAMVVLLGAGLACIARRKKLNVV
jgi:hypothetical protein